MKKKSYLCIVKNFFGVSLTIYLILLYNILEFYFTSSTRDIPVLEELFIGVILSLLGGLYSIFFYILFIRYLYKLNFPFFKLIILNLFLSIITFFWMFDIITENFSINDIQGFMVMIFTFPLGYLITGGIIKYIHKK